MPEIPPKLGILLPTRGLLLRDEAPSDAEVVLRMARTVEDAGLDSVWVGDSLTAKPRLEPLATLAAIAARTERVRLGTAVLLMALRHPLLLAQTLGTVDLISGGRVLIAAGAGGAFNEEQQQEWRSVGVDSSRRAGRLVEMARIVKGLTSGDTVSFTGRHFDLEPTAMLPRSPRPGGVPLLLACHGRSRRARTVSSGGPPAGATASCPFPTPRMSTPAWLPTFGTSPPASAATPGRWKPPCI